MAENLEERIVFLDDKNTAALIRLSHNIQGGSEALEFTSGLHDLIEKNVKKVILDLSDVELINSSGLGMLASGYSMLKKQNIELFLYNVPEKVSKLLTMTHLDKVLQVISEIESVS